MATNHGAERSTSDHLSSSCLCGHSCPSEAAGGASWWLWQPATGQKWRQELAEGGEVPSPVREPHPPASAAWLRKMKTRKTDQGGAGSCPCHSGPRGEADHSACRKPCRSSSGPDRSLQDTWSKFGRTCKHPSTSRSPPSWPDDSLPSHVPRQDGGHTCPWRAGGWTSRLRPRSCSPRRRHLRLGGWQSTPQTRPGTRPSSGRRFASMASSDRLAGLCWRPDAPP